jgi:LytS/YehU family sensor histidine kinase
MISHTPGRGGLVLLHVLFWATYGALLYASLNSWRYPQSVIWTSLLSDTATSATISYLNFMFLLPRLYGQGKYRLYVTSSIAIMLVLIILRVTLIGQSHFSIVYTYFIRSLPIIVFYLITTVVWFFNNLISAKRLEVELKNSQLDSELKFLKLQLSPHFLFNTLNNIYSMAYFNDPNTAPAVLKLSGMMRHMLHEGQGRFVSLSKEINFMENFIALWRLKLDEKPQIAFTYHGITEDHKIAPLIFLAFLENAFKHGNTISGKISIRLNVIENDVLHLNIKNDVIDVPNTLEEKSGVGLANVRKRLDLMYPGKHNLTISSKPDSYEVDLTIEL